MNRKTIQFSPARSGFTVIEMLATLLIAGALMALAVSAYQSARDNAQNMDCRANMRAIANMDETYKYKYPIGNPGHAYTTTLSNLSAIGPVPVCPGSGTYTLSSNNGKLDVTCTIHGAYTQDATA